MGKPCRDWVGDGFLQMLLPPGYVCQKVGGQEIVYHQNHPDLAAFPSDAGIWILNHASELHSGMLECPGQNGGSLPLAEFAEML